MISPSYISRILTDRSLTESQKSDTIFGLVQDAFIDGYSIGTERLITTIKDRESVIQITNPPEPVEGAKYIALQEINTDQYNIFKDKAYRIELADENYVYITVGHTIAELPIATFYKNFKIKK